MNINRFGWLFLVSIFPIAFVRADSGTSRSKTVPDGWQTAAPREEIRPNFKFAKNSGRSGKGAFVIEHDGREGLDGSWVKTFPIQGGHFYRFEAFRKTE